MRNLQGPKDIPPKRITLDESALEQLIKVCDSPLERAIVLLLVTTGVKASECCDHLLSDMDLEKQTLTARLGKGNKTRRVGIPSVSVPSSSGLLSRKS